MESQIREKISILKDAKSVRRLHKGFSDDQKYVIDEEWLLRVFSSREDERRKTEFDTIRRLSTLSDRIPEAVRYDVLQDEGLSFMVLGFVAGEDGEAALPKMLEKDQYLAGVEASKELAKLHQLPAPQETEPWYEVKKQKNSRYIEGLRELDIEPAMAQTLSTYLCEHEHLMKDRPNRFQHDDFLPSNLIFKDGRFAGLIDFQRMDWGDPLHDLQKLGFFSKQVSVPFSRGAIDGYREHVSSDEKFWRLYAYYSAVHVVSSLVWAKKEGPDVYDQVYGYALEVMDDHDSFTREIPKWYRTSGGIADAGHPS
ncbi:aminoglycoside phosphotransferase [Alteribacter lacisalsi]|uniref:Aminoglycoside phosphotransferase n=1 Tax=Alteribacter lacisalsi TaxID=2045244 RepID=A0A2W0H6Z7_9BACI|nr:aminoglycoside phosphotransferase family protein [Alteribacter lacisalsi]PYZ97624.1 aminoglycoside phosphotransferase [Alteribacter lacisalsi]